MAESSEFGVRSWEYLSPNSELRTKKEVVMPKKVLLVEDSLTDAAIVKEILEKEDVDVAVAGTGNEGVKLAEKIKPDLVILDLILPDISGFEVCAKLKQDVSLNNAIIVIFSVKDSIEDISKAFQLGADDYVIKPPQPEFLVKKIRLYLGMR